MGIELILYQNPGAPETLSLYGTLRSTRVSGLVRAMRALARDLEYGPCPSQIKIPEALSKASLRLLCFSGIGMAAEPRQRLATQFSLCRRLVEQGKKTLYRSLVQSSLRNKEAVMPCDIVAILLRHIAKDVTRGAPDIQSSYFT